MSGLFLLLSCIACLSSVFWMCFVLEAQYSLEALGFVLAARCLHYPFIACCPLLAISFHRLLPVAYITLSSRVCACCPLLALSFHRLLPAACNVLSSLDTRRLHYPAFRTSLSILTFTRCLVQLHGFHAFLPTVALFSFSLPTSAWFSWFSGFFMIPKGHFC